MRLIHRRRSQEFDKLGLQLPSLGGQRVWKILTNFTVLELSISVFDRYNYHKDDESLTGSQRMLS